LKIFREEISSETVRILPKTKPDHVKWFVEYYASQEKFTFQDIAEMEPRELTDNAIGKAVRKLKRKLPEKSLGDMLERALAKYLFRRFQ